MVDGSLTLSAPFSLPPSAAAAIGESVTLVALLPAWETSAVFSPRGLGEQQSREGQRVRGVC